MTENWTPTNTAATHVCTVLLRAHSEERIRLSWTDVMTLRTGQKRQLLPSVARERLGALWRKHNGWQFGEDTDLNRSLSGAVREELSP